MLTHIHKWFAALLLVFSVQCSIAQITFQKMIVDNADFSYSSGAAVAQTGDGGYILAGTYRFLLGNEANSYLVKTDAYGDTLWTKVYRDRDSMEIATSVQQTTDGGYILCGWFLDGESGYSWYVRKTDNSGNITWNKYFTGTSGNSRAYAVIQTGDGDFAVAGEFDELTAGLIKMDANGNTLWTKQYSRNDADQVVEGFSLFETSDNGFVISGYTPDAWPYYNSAVLIKTDSSGNVLWNKAFNNLAGWSYSVKQTNDGGFVMAGIAGDTLGLSDILLVKTDDTGAIQWSKVIGSSGEEWAGEVSQTQDGGYILSGISNSFGIGTFNYMLTKTDGSGNIEWSKIYDEAADLPHLSVYPSIYCVKQTTDAGFIGGGLFYSSAAGYAMCMIKTDNLGSSGCNESDAKPSVSDIVIPATSLSLITLNQIDTLGDRAYSVFNNGIPNTFCLNVSVDVIPSEAIDVSVFPNPTSGNLSVRLNDNEDIQGKEWRVAICDMAGRVIYSDSIKGSNTTYVNVNLSSGIYTVKITLAKKSLEKKLVVY